MAAPGSRIITVDRMFFNIKAFNKKPLFGNRGFLKFYTRPVIQGGFR